MIKHFGSKVRPQPLSGVHVSDEEMDEERITTYKVGLPLPVSEIKLQMSGTMKLFYLNTMY